MALPGTTALLKGTTVPSGSLIGLLSTFFGSNGIGLLSWFVGLRERGFMQAPASTLINPIGHSKAGAVAQPLTQAISDPITTNLINLGSIVSPLLPRN